MFRDTIRSKKVFGEITFRNKTMVFGEMFEYHYQPAPEVQLKLLHPDLHLSKIPHS